MEASDPNDPKRDVVVVEVRVLEPMLTLEELCRWLGIRKEFVHKLVTRGVIPVHRVDTLLRFDPAEIRQWTKTSADALRRRIPDAPSGGLKPIARNPRGRPPKRRSVSALDL